jgi:endoglucanase
MLMTPLSSRLLKSIAVLMPLALAACPREQPPSSWLGPTPSASTPTKAPKVNGLAGPFVSCEKTPVNELIRVDQFGYRPGAKKVAVLSDPVVGWHAELEMQPGSTYEVRAWDSGAVLFSGSPQLWNGGAVEKSSGDRGFWFDFSPLKTPGSYCIVDRERGFRSYRFDVRASVYRDALHAALKVFYFQRANLAKTKPYACVGEKCWIAAADNVGKRQDREARSVRDRDNPATARDLSGGWWDAGDVNKYVTFTKSPVHQLLTAYTERPTVFGDDFGIPESGNGVPDVLDELKVELDWLMKMQASDLHGGVLPKLGNVDFQDVIPEKSTLPRYYYPEPCSSATIVVAAEFAHAALTMRGVPQLSTYASELQTRARQAWAHFEQNPRNANCDDGTIKAGDSDDDLANQERSYTVAAIYLFALTGEPKYSEVIAKSYKLTRPMQDDVWSAYDPDQGDALLFYAALANADPVIKSAIIERKLTQARSLDIYGMKPQLDLYRAYMRDSSFHWGHNMTKANVGNTNYDLVTLPGDSRERFSYAERAEGLLQSFHGVNPLGIVYLTNMYAYGAEKSANQIFHSWFRDGDRTYDDAKQSLLGPPPGYVPGGPNAQYCKDQDPKQNRCATSELRRQPPQKAYFDFNTAWAPTLEHDRSWEITEPGIYYQSAYVKLVSKFVE